MTTIDAGVVWAIFVVAGAGTYAMRASFLALLRRSSQVPQPARRALALVPAAVLAALVAPALARSGGSVDLLTARFAAGMLAALVAWRTRNVIAVLVVGMGALWLLQGLG